MLIAPAVVTYTWIQQRKRAVKKEVKWKMIAGIDKSELVLLKFSKKETETKLQWKHSKEFEYNNQMYDIVDKITTKDSIKYWCWWDFEETKLNQQLSKLLANVYQTDIPTKEKQSQVIEFYKSLYFVHGIVWEPFIDSERFFSKTFNTNFYNYLLLKIDNPPPNSFS